MSEPAPEGGEKAPPNAVEKCKGPGAQLCIGVNTGETPMQIRGESRGDPMQTRGESRGDPRAD